MTKGARYLEEARALARLSAPIVLAQMGLMSMGLIDTIMVGHLSANALAAVAIGNIYHWGLLVVGLGILFALDPLVSQAHGAGDRDAIASWFGRGLVVAVVLFLPLYLAFQYAAPVLRLVRQPPEIIPIASAFVRANAPGILGFLLFTVLRQTLQAINITRPMLAAVAAGNLCNVALNYAFVFGHFGFPAWGAVGAGRATSISRYIMVLVLVLVARRTLAGMAASPSRPWRLAPYRRFLAIGIPAGLQIGLESWAFLAVSLNVGTLGVLALSGHQIALTLASFSFMLPLGVGAAAAVRVGNAIGRQDRGAARLAAITALGCGAAVMLVSAAAFAFAPSLLARIFTPDRDVIAMAVLLLPIAAIFQVFDGMQGVASGILRGDADTRIPAIAQFVGYWVLALPIGHLLASRFGWGTRGLWWGLTLGLATVAAILVLRVISRFKA